MRLSPDTTLGSYTILSLLGKGGMGEVWRARDTKLDRDVAIKVLPETLARDKERVLRFEREAKLLASLNHTSIAQIYGFEESGDQKFLVLEYVEGETLSQRLRTGALAVEDALDIARQIAEALEAAHDKAVIHRDLKPGNVMVRPDGTVKVLGAIGSEELLTFSFEEDSPIHLTWSSDGRRLATASELIRAL